MPFWVRAIATALRGGLDLNEILLSCERCCLSATTANYASPTWQPRERAVDEVVVKNWIEFQESPC